MQVKGTYFVGDGEDLEALSNIEKILKKEIDNNTGSIALYTDSDECIGTAIGVWVEEDHIVIEYEVDESFKEELLKEGFSISC